MEKKKCVISSLASLKPFLTFSLFDFIAYAWTAVPTNLSEVRRNRSKGRFGRFRSMFIRFDNSTETEFVCYIFNSTVRTAYFAEVVRAIYLTVWSFLLAAIDVIVVILNIVSELIMPNILKGEKLEISLWVYNCMSCCFNQNILK